MKNITENIQNDQNNEAKKIGKIVNKNQKIMVKIPVDPLNPLDKIIPVQINGYKWLIKRGETIMLPKECLTILQESGYLD